MQFKIDSAIEVLSRTPGVLRALLSGLSEPWVMNDYGADTFSPFDVVGHLIHGECTDWIPRARIILEYGETRAFEPFDRYAMYDHNRGRHINDLLDTFAALRQDNIEALRALNLTSEQLSLRGVHPELGTVTMEALLATWVAHDLNHIAQIAKAMSYQYREAVGPWRPYISVLPAD